MKNSYLLAGIRPGPFLHLLRRNNVSWTPRNTLRILFLLQSGCWSSLFSGIENLRYRKILEETKTLADPIFIIGHWRTGSTFLHQLMSRDPGLVAPTLFQVALPENFLVSYRFYWPLFNFFIAKTRPMDNVLLGMNEPQEDEYALFRTTTHSPLEQLIFPQEARYFMKLISGYPPAEKDREDWIRKISHFYRKLWFISHKQVVSKNPFNSFRIPLLQSAFPDARFIHIVRHPFDVIPSTRHLWSVVQRQNILNNHIYTPDVREIAHFMDEMMAVIQNDLPKIAVGRSAEIRFEELAKDPLGNLRDLYNELELPFSEEFELAVSRFLKEVSGYRKNHFSLSSTEQEDISGILSGRMKRYNYF